jgi:hypothetical protein
MWSPDPSADRSYTKRQQSGANDLEQFIPASTHASALPWAISVPAKFASQNATSYVHIA